MPCSTSGRQVLGLRSTKRKSTRGRLGRADGLVLALVEHAEQRELELGDSDETSSRKSVPRGTGQLARAVGGRLRGAPWRPKSSTSRARASSVSQDSSRNGRSRAGSGRAACGPAGLAGAALAEDQHGRPRRGDRRGELDGLLEARVVADQAGSCRGAASARAGGAGAGRPPAGVAGRGRRRRPGRRGRAVAVRLGRLRAPGWPSRRGRSRSGCQAWVTAARSSVAGSGNCRTVRRPAASPPARAPGGDREEQDDRDWRVLPPEVGENSRASGSYGSTPARTRSTPASLQQPDGARGRWSPP